MSMPKKNKEQIILPTEFIVPRPEVISERLSEDLPPIDFNPYGDWQRPKLKYIGSR